MQLRWHRLRLNFSLVVVPTEVVSFVSPPRRLLLAAADRRLCNGIVAELEFPNMQVLQTLILCWGELTIDARLQDSVFLQLRKVHTALSFSAQKGIDEMQTYNRLLIKKARSYCWDAGNK